MNILILIDAWFPFIGGAQIQIKNLKKILEKDYSCRYCILHSPSANIIIRSLWIFWAIPQAILLNKKHHFSLIHAHAYWPGIPGKILSILLKIPVVFTVHGSNLLDLQEKSWKAILEKYILTRVKYNQVISVSSSFLKYKNINKNIAVIPNGVDVERFKGLKVQRREIKQPTINNQPLTVLFVGRLEKIKGVNYLIKAFKEVTKIIDNSQLIIVGKGDEKERLNNLVKKLGIKDKIIIKYYSKYSDLIKEYLQADVFALPSLSEGQPLTLLEAWAAKLPVVITSVGSNKDMIKDGYNGYLVKPRDSIALADAIIKVLNDKERMLIGERGYKLVKEKYSWKICALKTYQIYEKFIKK